MYKYGENAPCYSAPRALEEDCHESLRCEDFKNWSYSIDNVDGSAVIRHHGITLTQDEKKWREKEKKILSWFVVLPTVLIWKLKIKTGSRGKKILRDVFLECRFLVQKFNFRRNLHVFWSKLKKFEFLPGRFLKVGFLTFYTQENQEKLLTQISH